MPARQLHLPGELWHWHAAVYDARWELKLPSMALKQCRSAKIYTHKRNSECLLRKQSVILNDYVLAADGMAFSKYGHKFVPFPPVPANDSSPSCRYTFSDSSWILTFFDIVMEIGFERHCWQILFCITIAALQTFTVKCVFISAGVPWHLLPSCGFPESPPTDLRAAVQRRRIKCKKLYRIPFRTATALLMH